MEYLDETIEHLTYSSYLAQRMDWFDPITASDKIKKTLYSWYPRLDEYERKYQQLINTEIK